jgi:hypothetical protein
MHLCLQAEVTQAQEASAAMEAARFTVVLVAEASAQEAIVAQNSAASCVKDAEDRGVPWQIGRLMRGCQEWRR